MTPYPASSPQRCLPTRMPLAVNPASSWLATLDGPEPLVLGSLGVTLTHQCRRSHEVQNQSGHAGHCTKCRSQTSRRQSTHCPRIALEPHSQHHPRPMSHVLKSSPPPAMVQASPPNRSLPPPPPKTARRPLSSGAMLRPHRSPSHKGVPHRTAAASAPPPILPLVVAALSATLLQ